MSLGTRLQGVVFNPKATMADIARNPKPWVIVLILTLLLTAVFSVLTFPYASRDGLQTMTDNARLRERLGPDRYDQMIAAMENPGPGAALRSSVFGPLMTGLALVLQALLLLVLGRLVSTEGAYLPVLSVLLHAGLVDKILGGAVRTTLALIQKSVLQTSTGLALAVPNADYTSTPFILLSQVDFFQLWMFGLLGYGLAEVFKIPVRKAMILSYSFWALKVAVNAALAFLGRSFLG